MKISTRDYGIYWVYYNSRWMLADFQFGDWYMFGTGIEMKDTDFSEIGPMAEFSNKPEDKR